LIPGDELDITEGAAGEVEAAPKADTKTEVDVDSAETVSEGSGIGMLSKMVFFLVICGAIFGFLKTRKTPGLTEKSLA